MDQRERVKIHLTEQTDRLGNSTERGVYCNPLPSGNQWYISRIGKLFADDLAIYITIKYQRVSARALQGGTNKLNTWAAERGLTFSPNKTVSIVFRKRRKRNEEPLKIMLNYKLYPLKKIPNF